MSHRPTSLGLLIALLAAATFGMSGAFIKPLLESGWSPVAAVTVRAAVGGLVLLPFALVSVRGRWDAVWRGRWRLLGMALVGVAGTQVLYFAAIQRIPVSTGILVEYLAPVLLVAVTWALSRRAPHAVVLAGSAVAVAGLVLVVSPGGAGALDPFGLLLAVVAMVGCAAFYVIAARPSDGLPPVALASGGLLIGALALAAVGATGLLPVTVSFADVDLFGRPTAWWVPIAVVGVLATAVAYASSITATELLGSRLASFVGLLEVVAATLYAWLLLGEKLSPLQLLGGLLILAGIALVRADRTPVPVASVPTPVAASRGRNTP
ncbi:EamA family transporter [Leifsonia sp. C5G2]|uniref:DMT family transporter n=1 Tax=Leifsonia sp. C5G2 TaxID=2735269 RepID=UPI0015852884|nr:EamA family transporter [Leifsonia sp. C5G2]NUU06905.1 EamA family transporter [Leifsonia sp. C5G2]